MARTLVTEDPLFGWIAYGGAWTEEGSRLSVIPRDGVRKRFDVVVPDPRAPWLRAQRLKIEIDRDHFAAERPVEVDKALTRVAFTLENGTGEAHETELWLWLPYGTEWALAQDGAPVELTPAGDWDHPWRATLRMAGIVSRVELVRTWPE